MKVTFTIMNKLDWEYNAGIASSHSKWSILPRNGVEEREEFIQMILDDLEGVGSGMENSCKEKMGRIFWNIDYKYY